MTEQELINQNKIAEFQGQVFKAFNEFMSLNKDEITKEPKKPNTIVYTINHCEEIAVLSNWLDSMGLCSKVVRESPFNGFALMFVEE